MTHSSFNLQVSQWFNTPRAIELDQLKGRVVVISAFQMLCPSCVSHSLPQMSKLHQMLDPQLVTVIGLHTVFEHHNAMLPVSLEAFIHEYRLQFPIGVDSHVPGQPVPSTMRKLQLRGTPSTVILDQQGNVALHHFGHVDDLALGLTIGQLLNNAVSHQPIAEQSQLAGGCSDKECAIPAR